MKIMTKIVEFLKKYSDTIFIFNIAIIYIIDLFPEGSDTDEDDDEDSRVS